MRTKLNMASAVVLAWVTAALFVCHASIYKLSIIKSVNAPVLLRVCNGTINNTQVDFLTTTNPAVWLTNPVTGSAYFRGILLFTNLATATVSLITNGADARAVGFRVYCNTNWYDVGMSASFTFSNLFPGLQYVLTARFRDISGNLGSPSQPVIYWPLPIPQTNTLKLTLN